MWPWHHVALQQRYGHMSACMLVVAMQQSSFEHLCT